MSLPRRSALALALPMLGLGCARGGDEGPPLSSGPPSYRHLTALNLAVGAIEIVDPAPGAATLVIPPAPIEPAVALTTMARDRVVAAGGPGRARFAILGASLTRQPESGGGLFSGATERIACFLRCRLEILSPDGEAAGHAEAEVRRTAVARAGSTAERVAAADRIVRQAMADMNVEFEFQVRRHLRGALAPGAGGAAAGQAPQREDLPRT